MLQTLRMYCFVAIFIRTNVVNSNGVIQNYQYYFDIGKPVYSPVFYTQVSGYCFKLYVQWSGKNKENLELYWKLCHGKNNYKELKPFRVSFRIQFQGREVFNPIFPLIIGQIMGDYFTIYPDEDEARRWVNLGIMHFNPFDHVVDDTLLITCIFKHDIRYQVK